MFGICNHEWEVVSDKLIPPKIDLNIVDEVSGVRSDHLVSKHVFIMSCKKCGKIYKSVETN